MKLTIKITPELRIRLRYAETLEITVPDEPSTTLISKDPTIGRSTASLEADSVMLHRRVARYLEVYAKEIDEIIASTISLDRIAHARLSGVSAVMQKQIENLKGGAA